MKREDQFPKLINDMGLKIGLEVGVQCGIFSECLLRNSNLDHLFCVDSWSFFSGREPRHVKEFDSNYHKALQRLLPHAFRCSLIKLLSINAVHLFKDGFFDYIYIDAGHTYEDVKEDIATWYPKLRKGGVMSFHDYHQQRKWMGVIKAVDEFVEQNNYKLNITSERCTPSAWFIKK